LVGLDLEGERLQRVVQVGSSCREAAVHDRHRDGLLVVDSHVLEEPGVHVVVNGGVVATGHERPEHEPGDDQNYGDERQIERAPPPRERRLAG